jgi:hypothetical protein
MVIVLSPWVIDMGINKNRLDGGNPEYGAYQFKAPASGQGMIMRWASRGEYFFVISVKSRSL